jgi:hypothetical protein
VNSNRKRRLSDLPAASPCISEARTTRNRYPRKYSSWCYPAWSLSRLQASRAEAKCPRPPEREPGMAQVIVGTRIPTVPCRLSLPPRLNLSQELARPHDLDALVFAPSQQISVLGDDAIRPSLHRAFQDPVVVRVFRDDVERSSGCYAIRDASNLLPRAMQPVSIPPDLSLRTPTNSSTIASDTSMRIMPARAMPNSRAPAPPYCNAEMYSFVSRVALRTYRPRFSRRHSRTASGTCSSVMPDARPRSRP